MIKYLKFFLFYFFVVATPLLSNNPQHFPQIENYMSPSLNFITLNSEDNIAAILNKFGATNNNKAMFQYMIDHEYPGFFGYHAGSSDYRIFQDVIKIALEEYLNIPIRPDFQFLRIPGEPDLSFESADAFVAQHPSYNDNLHEIRKHILSLNMALYKSWDAEWDFTPRYFLQNKPWTAVSFESVLLPFFEKIGLDSHAVMEIFTLAHEYVPQETGMILQFFDGSHQMGLTPYAFLDEQAFIGTSSRKIPNTTPSEYYTDLNKMKFPQLRLVMNNFRTLNPYSPLIILRYSTMTSEREAEYENALRGFMRTLSFDQEKAEAFRNELLDYWNL